MGRIRQVIWNTATGWGALLVRSVIALLLVPVLIGAMGKDAFGLVGLFSALISLSTVADLGLRSALGRELAEKVTRNDPQGFRGLSVTALGLYCMIALLLSVAIAVFAPWIVTLFKVEHPLWKDAVFLLRIYGPTTFFASFILPVFSSGLSSFMRFDTVNVLQMSVSLASHLLVLVLVTIFPERALYIWVLIMAMAGVVNVAACYFAYRKLCYGGIIDPRLIDSSYLRPLFSLGWQMYVIQLARVISEGSDPIILSSFLGPGSVALYHPASRLSSMLNPAVMTLTGQLYPLTTEYHATGRREDMVRLLCLGTRYTLLLGVLVASGLFLFAEPFARLWLSPSLGPDYMIVAQVIKAYAIIDLMTYASGTQWPVLLGMKRLGFLIRLLTVTAVLNIVLSIYMVGFTSVGIIGVLIGTAVSKLIRLIFLNVYIVRLMQVSPAAYVGSVFLRPAVCLLCTASVGWVLLHYHACDTWISLVMMAGMTVAAWGVCCMLFGASRKEFATARAWMRSRWGGGSER